MTTDWDQCYREGTTPWDRGEPSPPLRQWLENHPHVGKVIVPGCGRGHDVALIAAMGGDPVGLDISEEAIRLAKATHPALAERFIQGDLFQIPPAMEGAFDALIEHTCLSGLPPHLRPAYAAACCKLIKPGGRIIGVWFIHPDLDPGETGPPFPLPLDELDQMFDSGFEIVEDYVPDVAFEGREGRERLRVLRKTA